MEPQDSSLIDDSMLLVSMDISRIRETISDAKRSVPGARGINNHMGSKFTADPDASSRLARVLKEEGLFFVDSWTSGDSVAYEAARRAGVPAARNDFFIDNKNEYDYILARLEKLASKAAQRKVTVAIGHVQRKNTARALEEVIPMMKEKGITFVSVEDILQ